MLAVDQVNITYIFYLFFARKIYNIIVTILIASDVSYMYLFGFWFINIIT